MKIFHEQRVEQFCSESTILEVELREACCRLRVGKTTCRPGVGEALGRPGWEATWGP